MKKIITLTILIFSLGMLYSTPQQEIQEKEKPIYIIVNNEWYTYLEDEVNIKIKEGYIPYGGVSCGAGYGKREFVQAMVLEAYFNAYIQYLTYSEIPNN